MLKQIVKKALPLLLGLAILLGPFLFGHKTVNAANPSTINFQGKVVNSNGTNVADGTYSFVFRIYNTSSPTPTTACTSDAACLWQETQASVSVTNGIFQVELGSACALTSGSCNNSAGGPINFATNNALYLTMQFNGDTSGTHGGFMWPVIHLTSVPFALQADNASTLGGLSNGNFVQLAQGLQTDASTSNASIAINKTGGTANILTLQKSGANVLLLDNNGLLTLQPAASLTSGQTAFTQTLTNASSTGGTVNGELKSITVNNTSSASTTNGINISLTDNTALSNNNIGINISLSGTNTSQDQIGVNSNVNAGTGIKGVSTGPSAFGGCTSTTTGVCGISNYSNDTSGGVGVYGSTNGGSSNINGSAGGGVIGTDTAAGAVSDFYTGIKGLSTQTASAAYTSTGVYGKAKAGSGATTYGGYFQLDSGSSATLGAALYATNSTVAANILDLQDNTSSVFTVGDNGLISLQPAAALTGTGTQNNVSQTLTNNQTAGTVNGYNQSITVSNASGTTTTNGLNISITDNAPALVNTNNGIKITLNGSNTSQSQLGVDSLVNHGIGIRGTSSGSSSTFCGNSSVTSVGICGATSVANSGTGVFGVNDSDNTSSLTNNSGAGVIGFTDATGTASKIYVGVKGLTNSTGAAAYTSAGVVGQANGGAGATIYGGYFTVGTAGATAGAALYATNSTVAANILDLQDNTTSVFTVGDNGLISLQPAAALTGTGTQNNVSQTLTNNQTAGTVNGYNQSITVSGASGSSNTNGFNISLTDNTSLGNNNTGIKITLSGSNTNQNQAGIDVSVNAGYGIRSISSGLAGPGCGAITGGSIGVCGGSSYSSGTGVAGYTSGSTSLNNTPGSGVYGLTSSSGSVGNTYAGVKGITTQSTAAAYTSVGVFGLAKGGAGATTYGGYFGLDSAGGATAGAALYASNSTVAANILDLQDNTTSVFTVGDGGLITLQPAANLTSGQTEVAQTLTNASSTGGTVNGYSQTITVNNTTSASTTNAFNISLTDNTALSNTNQGINIILQGSNSVQSQYGVNVSVNAGVGINAVSSGAGNSSCGGQNISIGICGSSNASGGGLGVMGTTNSGGSSITSLAGTGSYGFNNASGTAGKFYVGMRGESLQTVGASYTSIGSYGRAKGGSGATTYGGYFALDSGSSATLGAALYATNSTVAANILQLQDNSTDVLTVGDGGLVTFTSNSTSGLLVKDSSTSKTVFNVDTFSDNVNIGQPGPSGLTGTLVFNNGTNNKTVSINAGPTTANYNLTLPTTGPGTSQCLQTDSVTASQLTFGSCATGGGYATIQDEGSSLTQRTTVNFIGNSVACVDNSGSSRTDCTVAPTLQNAYDNSGSPATIVSSSSSKNIIFQSGSSSNSTGFFQIQNSSGSSGTLLNADTSNMRLGVNVTYSSMSAPSGLTSTASAGTGFTAGDSYLYEVTAIDSLGGETTVSNEPTACAPASSNLRCTLSWT